MTGQTHRIRAALGSAVALIIVALILALVKRADWLGPRSGERAVGLFSGAFLLVIGNFLPKRLEPLGGRCGVACKKSVQRFAGWTLVLAGIAYCASWVVAPVAVARFLSLALSAACILLVGGRIAVAWTTARP